MRCSRKISWVAVFLASCSIFSSAGWAKGKKCLHISSYSLAYEWAAGIDRSLWKQINAKCSEKRTFFLDAKANVEAVPARALEAKELIEKMKPDVVIVSDDVAVKHVLQAHFKGASIPFVFCGVNWSVTEYGLPYSNATGMIEVNAIDAVVEETSVLLPLARSGLCLAEPSETGHKLCQRLRLKFKKSGIDILEHFPNTFQDWKESFEKAQTAKFDFVLLPVVHAIKDFDFEKARTIVLEKTRKMSISLYDWMVPYSVLTFVTPPEEQGEYAGAVAAKILNGAKPSDFSVVTNRKWELIINKKLVEVAGFKLPASLLRKGVGVTER